MRKRNPVEGAKAQVTTGKEVSNLEAKKKMIQDSKINPEITDLPENYDKRSRFAEKAHEDEKETGMLEEDEGESGGLKEEEINTGLLPEDDDEEDYEVPELQQRDVGERKQQPSQNNNNNRRRAGGISAVESRYGRHQSDDSEEENQPRQNPNRKQNQRPQGNNRRPRTTDEKPPVPVESRQPQNRGGNSGRNRGGNQGDGGGKGAGLVVGLIIAILLVLLVVAFFIIRAVRPDLINGLFEKKNKESEQVVQQQQQPFSTTEDFSDSLYYSSVATAIQNLYTDSDKHDIREDVTNEEVKSCLDLLAVYQSSDEYNEKAYNELSNELQTISLFLQDRETYNALMNEDNTFTPEERESKLQGIRNDIMMYRVQSLTSAMNAKLSILETMGTVEGSDDPLTLEDLGYSDDTSGGLEKSTENTSTDNSQSLESSNVMQTWGTGGGMVVEQESE